MAAPGNYLTAIALLFLCLLPYLVLTSWLLNGTNLEFEGFGKKMIVGVHTLLGVLMWGGLLLSALFMPFEHQQTIRVRAANTLHPGK